MPFTAGYLVDLSTVKLDEATNTSWIQAMPYGKWNHPIHGEIDLNSDNGKEYADNINGNVRGQQLDIDYDHKEKTGEAAGWVKKAEARSDAVWLEVEWTPTAFQKLKEKAYKYFSPEFQDEWKHPSTNVTHKNVVFGGGLTNRPFLKGIMPINLSEVFASEQGPNKNEGGKSMKPEQIKSLAAKLGLAEDATEEAVLEAMDKAEIKTADAPKPEDDKKVDEDSPTLVAAKEALAEAKKLSEAANGANLKPLVALMEIQAKAMETQEQRITASESALRLTEIDNAVKTLNEVANKAGYTIPVPVRDNYKKFLSEHGLTKKLSEDFSEVVTGLLGAKLIQLGEKGKLRVVGGQDHDKTALVELSERSAKLREADKTLSLTDANTKVFAEDPELYERYREEQSSNAAGGE